MLCHLSALAGYIIPFGNVLGPLLVWQIKKNFDGLPMPNSFFGWIAGYDKKATVEECIETAQYSGRLIGYYEQLEDAIRMVRDLRVVRLDPAH
jgi:hypothetical protein